MVSRSRGTFLAVAALVWAATGPVATQAQPAAVKGKPKAMKEAELKRLDAKMEEFRASFLRDISTLIKSYEDIGQYERSKVLLEALQKLDPQSEPVKEKLAQIKEQMLTASEFEYDIDPAKPWQAVGSVAAGTTLRIRVAGEYKLVTTATVAADGLAGDNPAEDLIPNVPFGAVMAVIAPAGSADRPAGDRKNDKQPRPFTVGSGYEKPVAADGVLYLKVNLPPGSKCTGRLAARISGASQATQP